MTLGLVLGGGGVVGVAWEVGVLAAIAQELGWDPSAAGTVVGTSAGALIGAQLLTGTPLDELVEAERAPAPAPPVAAAGADGDAAPAGDPSKVMEIFRLWGGADTMDTTTARAMGQLAAEVPTVDEDTWLSVFTPRVGQEWPDGDLRVTGVSVRTGGREVWTARSAVPLVRAVAASCAVPGLFPPVAVGDATFIDGGVWSGSNLDVLDAGEVDAALFIGPMGVSPGGIGGLSSRSLEREIEVLAARGIEAQSVEPGERFAAAGLMLMDSTRRAEALEIGLHEGAEAAATLKALLA